MDILGIWENIINLKKLGILEKTYGLGIESGLHTPLIYGLNARHMHKIAHRKLGLSQPA